MPKGGKFPPPPLNEALIMQKGQDLSYFEDRVPSVLMLCEISETKT